MIAVDQQLAHGVTPDVGTTAQSNRTVTLEVLPEAAERVAVAVRLGRVSLTVRAAVVAKPAPSEGDAAVTVGGVPAVRPALQVTAPQQAGPQRSVLAAKSPPPTTWGYDVSPALGQRAEPSVPARSNSVKVFQGGGGEKEFKFE